MRVVHGVRKWGPLDVDEEGHRNYKLGVLLRTNNKFDGPANMYNTPGTPLPGSAWNFGDDSDDWAFCKNTCTVSRFGVSSDDSAVVGASEPWIFWIAEYNFSTKPPDRQFQRCSDTPIENPLLEPFKYSGDYKRYTEEAYFDMYGRAITTSSWEQLRGQQVEFDKNRPSLTIEQNVSDLQLPLLTAFMDCVNDRPMWGLPARTIKLSNAPWEKIFYGTCYYYFKRRLEFEINFDTWDRVLLDNGTSVLNGHWHETTRHWVIDPIDNEAPDRFNPSHFKQYTDYENQPARITLDGQGLPAGACIDYYDTASFDVVPPIYMSVLGSIPTLPNVGNSLNNRQWWIKWKAAEGETAFALPPNPWSGNKRYKPGNTVSTTDGNQWVCLVSNINDVPILGNPLNTNWNILGSGLSDKGTYDKTTSYSIGDYVTSFSAETCQSRDAGQILVQKYFPANFLLLGVPLLLPV